MAHISRQSDTEQHPAPPPTRSRGGLRIGIDARYAYDHFPGIGRYTVNLARALCALGSAHTFVLLHNPQLPNTRYDLPALAHLPNVQLATLDVPTFAASEQTRMPVLVRALRLDLLHSPYYIKPYFGLPCPSVVSIHDLIGRRYPHTLPARSRLLYRITMALAVRTASAIITSSRSTRRDLGFYYGLPPSHVAVTPYAADARFAPQPYPLVLAMRERYALPPRYVLYLGANKPHKNLERLVLAWERVVAAAPDRDDLPRLVLAGHYDPRYPAARDLVGSRGLEPHVAFVPNVAEADVPALYSGAEVFVFPSFYEGFGLPPLEAMACGTPVLCAYASSLPEVVGRAALTFDPFNVPELAAELQRLIDSPALRRELSAQSLQQARRFSWERTARETLDVYELVARARARP
jgi:alpha-1,3-rhamnosyl/mannosyltransferase